MDSRIKDLGSELNATQLQALIASLYMVVDETSLSEANKVLFKTLLSEAIVVDTLNNYQAMTPKAFYLSVMTTARKGIGLIASDAEINAKSGSNIMTSVHQAIMQVQWFKDWFISNGGAGHYEADNYGNSQAMSFDVNFYNTATKDVLYVIGPAHPRNYFSIYYNVNCYYPGVGVQYGVTDKLAYSGSAVEKLITGSALYIGLEAGGTNIYLRQSLVTAPLVFSAHFNCCML